MIFPVCWNVVKQKSQNAHTAEKHTESKNEPTHLNADNDAVFIQFKHTYIHIASVSDLFLDQKKNSKNFCWFGFLLDFLLLLLWFLLYSQ